MPNTFIAFKSIFWFCYFFGFFVQKISHFFVSLYKELLEPTFLPFFIVLDNLCEVFRCSAITDFISVMFGFSKVFG